MTAADVVLGLVENPTVGHGLRGVQAALLQPCRQFAGDQYLPHQPPFALDGVDLAVTTPEFAVQGRPEIGSPFITTAQGVQLVRPEASGMGDLGGEAVALGLGGGDQRGLQRGVGPGLKNLLGLCLDDGQTLTGGECSRHVLHHALHGLPLHIERFLPHIQPALLQVTDRQLGGHAL